MDEMNQPLEYLVEANASGASLELNKIVSILERLEKSISNISASLGGVKSASTGMASAIGKVQQANNNAFDPAKVKKYTTAMSDSVKEAKRMADAVGSLPAKAPQLTLPAPSTNSWKPSAELDAKVSGILELANKVRGTRDILGSTDTIDLSYNISVAEGKVKSLVARMKAEVEGSDVFEGLNAQLKEQFDVLDKLTAKYEDLLAAAKATGNVTEKATKPRASEIFGTPGSAGNKTPFEGPRRRASEVLGEGGSGLGKAEAERLKELEQVYKRIDAIQAKISRNQMLGKGGNAATRVLKMELTDCYREAVRLQRATGQIGGVEAMLKNVRLSAKGFAQAHAHAAKLRHETKRISRKMINIGRTLQLMAVRMGVRAIMKDMGEGFAALAKGYEPFNESMSDMMNSATKVRNSLISAFDPIIRAAAPTVIRFLDTLAVGFDRVAQAAAAMTGATTYQKLTSEAQNYSDVVNEIKNSLAGFDKFNLIGDKASSGDGPKTTVETADIDPQFLKWRQIGEGLKEIFEGVEEVAYGVADVIGDILGLADDEDAFKTVGTWLKNTGTWIKDNSDGISKLIIGFAALKATIGVGTWFKGKIDKLGSIFGFGSAGKDIGAAASKLKNAGSNVSSKVKTSFTSASEKLKTAGTHVSNKVKTAASSASADLRSAGTYLATKIKTACSSAAAQLRNAGSSVATNISTSAAAAATKLQLAGSSLSTSLNASTSLAASKLLTSGTSVSGNLLTSGNRLSTNLLTASGQAANTLTGAGTTLLSKLSSFSTGALTGLFATTMAAIVTAAVKDVGPDIANWNSDVKQYAAERTGEDRGLLSSIGVFLNDLWRDKVTGQPLKEYTASASGVSLNNGQALVMNTGGQTLAGNYNSQIGSTNQLGLIDAVADGVTKAMESYYSSHGTGGDVKVTVKAEADTNKLFKFVVDQNNAQFNRTGRSPLKT